MEMRSPVSELRDTLLARLSEAYTAYFDVEPVQDGSPLKALCAYHSRGSQYVLIKKAELWAAETHEYLYLYSLPRLDFTSLVELQARTLEDGMPRIRAIPSICAPICRPWSCVIRPTRTLWPSFKS